MSVYESFNQTLVEEDREMWSSLDPEEKKAWISVYGLLLTVATTGNVLVSCFIVARRRLCKAYGFYMMSLTLADFTMLYFECFFNFIYILEGDWWFGEFYCITYNSLSEMTMAASIFTLCLTSVDRFLAVVKPFHPRTSRNKAVIKVVMVWLLSALMAVPNVIFSVVAPYNHTLDQHGETHHVHHCFLQWPSDDGILNEQLYRMAMFVLTYLIPSLVLAYCNTRIGFVLWSATELDHQGIPQHQIELLVKKRKQLAKVMLSILVIFCLCWLPYQTFLMVQTFNPGALSGLSGMRVHMAVYWLATANALFDPILFYRMDKQYRTCVRSFFKQTYSVMRKQTSTAESTM